ncbi:hypothetical protein DQ04_04571010 [Trypanosoma grayi]|uniref:hypothetical protein n=1 Tax=Trypanosoma grayi TaxID=71804 RepID=UPI0004F42D36|nr:hypothetical protein DQ04_04571010 [Trypanosoma grayi]KEG09825.1 hypothetical protein DQ04_04571010 [Trypanosoma grayi]
MVLPQRRLVCPVLLDIGSSRAVALPYFYREVCPSLHRELRQIMARRGEQDPLLLRRSPNVTATLVDSWVRPCGFSPESPLLQHESWRDAWQTYICAVRQRGEVSVAGAAPIRATTANAAAKSRDVNDIPLCGTLALPIPVHVSDANGGSEAGASTRRITMEFFRVDAFIPVYVQMCHVMRRIIAPQNTCDVPAIGVVVPNHHTDYFIEAAKGMREGTASQQHSARMVPNILVYNTNGLQFRLP